MSEFHNCPHCNRKYKTQKKYDLHIKTHVISDIPSNNIKKNGKQRRNYNVEPPSKIPEKLFNCPVDECNRKYKSEEKVKNHIEKNHFYDTRGQPHKYSSRNFKHKIMAKIYESAAKYAIILHRIKEMNEEDIIEAVKSNSDEEMILCAKNLLPQKYGKEIDINELIRIAVAQHKFAQRIFEDNLLGRCDWKLVMEDLYSFIMLGLPYYDTNFCPTLPIDFLWHAMMQKPNFYQNYFKSISLKPIPHCIIERSEEEDLQRYEYFLKVFEYYNDRKPYVSTEQISSDTIIKIDEIYQSFDDMRSAELEKIAAKERAKLEKIAEEERAEEEKQLKEEREVARRKEIVRDFNEKAGVNISSIDWFGYEVDYRKYYLPFYKNGFTGEELEKKVQEKRNKEYNERSRMASSC